MQQKVRIGKLDEFKWIAAFLVVANHTSPLESLHETADFVFTRVLARVAVPFFFMVTGYFVLYAANRKRDGMVRIWASIKKTGFLYLVVTLLYLPVQIYKAIKEPIEPAALLGKGIKAVLFDGTYYHLWYLPAVMLGLLVCCGLLILGERAAFTGAGLLYLIGLLGDSYYGFAERILLLQKGYEGMFRVFSYTRNGLFFAPLFLLLGYAMASWRREGKAEQKRRNCILCLCALCGEGLLLHKYGMQRHDSMYLLLPVCMVYLFQYLLLQEGKAGKRSSFYLRGPMLVYFLHPLVILGVRGLVKVTKLTFLLEVSPVYYLVVAAGSIFTAYGFWWLLSWGADWKRRRSSESEG